MNKLLDVDQAFADGLVIHKNVKQEVVFVTKDKLKIRLMEHREILSGQEKWQIPLGILLATGPTLIAADFKDFLFSASVWEAIYLIVSGVSFLILLYQCYLAIKFWNQGSIDSLITKLLQESENDNAKESQDRVIFISKAEGYQVDLEKVSVGALAATRQLLISNPGSEKVVMKINSTSTKPFMVDMTASLKTQINKVCSK